MITKNHLKMAKKIIRVNPGEEFILANSVFTYSLNESGAVVITRMKELKGKLKKTKEFIPPTLDEVKAYFALKGYSEAGAIHAYEYYSEGNWTDSKGNAVINWKQKMLQNMMFDKDKIQSPQQPSVKKMVM
jgi:hypothetical protein